MALTSTSFSSTKQATFLSFCCHPRQLLLNFMESSVGTPQSVASQELLHPPVDLKRSESQPGRALFHMYPSLICHASVPLSAIPLLLSVLFTLWWVISLLLVFMCVCSIMSDSL